MEDKDIHKAVVEDHRQGPIRILPKQRSCAAYVAAGRKGIIERKAHRKPLIELLVITTQKPRDSKEWARRRCPPMTKYGCQLCKILLCIHGPCWQEHLN